MRSKRVPDYRETIIALGAKSPDLASAKVPSGMIRFWSHGLNSPSWIWEGTPFSSEVPIRRHIRLDHDLRLLANLIQNCGEAELFEMLVVLPRVSGLAQLNSAPDLRSAIELRAYQINSENPHLNVAIRKTEVGVVIDFHSDERLGPFRGFLEPALNLYFCRICTSFVSLRANAEIQGRGIVATTGCAPRSRIEGLLGRLGIPMKKACKSENLSLPLELLRSTNPGHDAQEWARICGLVQRSYHHLSHPLRVDRLSLNQFVSEALLRDGRPPNLPDVADMFGMTERSLSRRLSDQDLALRETTSEVRKQIAADLLREGNTSIAAIASKLGYSDASSFVRSFRRWYGKTPVQWRCDQIN